MTETDLGPHILQVCVVTFFPQKQIFSFCFRHLQDVIFDC